jgi:hypothetical protein
MSLSKHIIAGGTAVLTVAAIAAPGAGARTSARGIMCRTGAGPVCVHAGNPSCRVHLGRTVCPPVLREKW